MVKTVKAYRVFYTSFYESEHEKVKEILREIVGIEPIEHKSFIGEFRYLEFKSESLKPGLEAKIYEALASILGKDKGIKVDYINV
ncbi:MAG: hypothetical protein ACP5I2_05510 [Fervidicoccaceae archaeon]|nr:MAG: hypothetical protein C0179_02250 [Fervidicoccus sp.]